MDHNWLELDCNFEVPCYTFVIIRRYTNKTELNLIKGNHVPLNLVFAVRCVVDGEHVCSSLPAQHCPTVTNAADHQLHAIT